MVFEIDESTQLYYPLKFFRKCIYFWHKFFIFRLSVFYFSGDTNKYFVLLQKIILKYYMHLYDKYKALNSLERFLMHSSYGDMLIILFGKQKVTWVTLIFLHFRPGR